MRENTSVSFNHIIHHPMRLTVHQSFHNSIKSPHHQSFKASKISFIYLHTYSLSKHPPSVGTSIPCPGEYSNLENPFNLNLTKGYWHVFLPSMPCRLRQYQTFQSFSLTPLCTSISYWKSCHGLTVITSKIT